MFTNIFVKYRAEFVLGFEIFVGLLSLLFTIGTGLYPELKGIIYVGISIYLSIVVFLLVLHFSGPNYTFKIIGIYSHGIILTYFGDGIKDCLTGNFSKGIINVLVFGFILSVSFYLIYKRRKTEEAVATTVANRVV